MKKPIKKFIHTFIIDEKGAVSIFLIMIAILIFLFNAVLIDFARIIVAERQVEEATEVALRSTMSSYHQDLQDLGLFSFDGDEGEAESIFQETFNKNISPTSDGTFELLGLQAEEDEISLDLNYARNLTYDEILRYQILEEMKYKAPIEIGETILSNFLSLSEKVEEASEFSKIAKEVNELAEDREEKLDKVIELLEEAKEELEDVNHLVRNADSGESYPEITNTHGIYYFHFETYRDQLEAIEEFDNAEDDEETEYDEDEIDEFREDTATFKENAIDILERILSAGETAYEKVVEAIEVLGEAKDLNTEIITKIDNAENLTEDAYNDANEVADEMADESIDGEVDESVMESYKMDESLFNDVTSLLETAERNLKSDSIQNDALIDKIEVDFLPAVQDDFETDNKTRFEIIETIRTTISTNHLIILMKHSPD
jgi:hypothetical protein